ncbi:MAG: hypothetical protein AVDCRST_MAG89-3884, partial [uncultured Gemmatimonadetes bacterium]
ADREPVRNALRAVGHGHPRGADPGLKLADRGDLQPAGPRHRPHAHPQRAHRRPGARGRPHDAGRGAAAALRPAFAHRPPRKAADQRHAPAVHGHGHLHRHQRGAGGGGRGGRGVRLGGAGAGNGRRGAAVLVQPAADPGKPPRLHLRGRGNGVREGVRRALRPGGAAIQPGGAPAAAVEAAL